MNAFDNFDMSVDLKVLVLSVVCDDLLYAKITFGESQKSNLLMFFWGKSLAIK